LAELGATTEHDMALAFLQAEIDSVRWRDHYAAALQQLRLTRALVDQADLSDERANRDRISLLAIVRGYRANLYLFNGFPVDTTWRRVRFTQADFGLLRYGNRFANGDLFTLSGGTRRVVDAAANFSRTDTATSTNIRAVADAVRSGRRFPPLVAVDSGQGDFIMVEGYTRVTAYALVGSPPTVVFIVGSSPHIRGWVFY
jgi:hypothetical protein